MGMGISQFEPQVLCPSGVETGVVLWMAAFVELFLEGKKRNT